MAITIRNNARFVWESKSEDEEVEEKEDDPNKDTSNAKLDLDKKDKKPFELKGIELEVGKRQFVAVIGQVGSGKSSLISAILGEMELIKDDFGEKGKVNISEELRISYVAQRAWIQNDTFRGNILFGQPFDEEKYEQVIRACCLVPDLDQYEDGDLTEIGEKGITLSGGQKQRVSLARACYSAITCDSSKQIIMLDDVLSAVDAHVGKSLCDDVLNSRTGILRSTTRILVTNQLNQLGDLNVDQIILLKDGQIALKCTYDELMKMDAKLELDQYNLRLTSSQKTEKEVNKKPEVKSKATSDQKPADNEAMKNYQNKSKSKKLIEKEKQEVGDVSFKHYLVYLRKFGYINAIVIVVFLGLENYFQLYSEIYLAEWTNTRPNTTDAKEIRSFNRERLLYFSLYSLSECVFELLEDTVFFFGALSIFRLFHQQLLHKVLRSPMSFFEKTPVGRIIGRFTSDISKVDHSLPRVARSFILGFLKLFVSLSLLVFKTDATTIACFLIIFTLHYHVWTTHKNASRQLKRYRATTVSPILTHLSESLNGLSTIRAFGKTNEFRQAIQSKIDVVNQSDWCVTRGYDWLSFNLNCLTSLILLVVSIQTVLRKNEMNGGEAGLLIVYDFLKDNFFTTNYLK